MQMASVKFTRLTVTTKTTGKISRMFMHSKILQIQIFTQN